MNPAVPETKGGVGASFKGTAMYLLHDKNADTAERVMWAETRNLATDDPQLAARLMAATAMDADNIKRRHAEANSEAYRSSKRGFNHVFHYALTWHPDEAAGLTRDVMMREAKGSLRALGADDLQSLIVCHMDTDHPHLHIMVNRVHPETGKTVPVEKHSQRKLSKFCLERDKERGFTYAPQREINANKRDAGIPYRAEKRVPRHIFEQQRAAQEAARERPDLARGVRAEQAKFDHSLAAKERDMIERHRKQSRGLSTDHNRRKALINADSDQAKKKVKKQLGKRYEAQIEQLTKDARAEIQELAKREQSAVGKLGARFQAIGKSWKLAQAETLAGRVAQTFQGFGKQGYAAQVLKKDQERRQEAAGARFRSDLRGEVRKIETTRKEAISANYERYKQQHSDLKRNQAGDKVAMRAEWRSRDQARIHAWDRLKDSVKLQRDYKAAASPAPSRETSKSTESVRPGPQRTRE